MVKGVPVKEFTKKNDEELVGELKRLREELQTIRFTKGSGTAVAKIAKIKGLRRSIARVLTVINQNKKTKVVERLRVRSAQGEDAVKNVEKTIKNLKAKHLPVDLRAKKTRAIRRRLTRSQSKRVPLKLLKRKLNFPKRRFAVPVSSQ